VNPERDERVEIFLNMQGSIVDYALGCRGIISGWNFGVLLGK